MKSYLIIPIYDYMSRLEAWAILANSHHTTDKKGL